MNSKVQSAVLKSTVCFLSLALLRVSAYAVGSGAYENQVPSARALGRANSVVASIDDASAVAFNAARLTSINGGDASLGLTYQNIKTKFDGSIAGMSGSESTKSDPGYSPNFHIAHRFGLEKWGFGLGVDVPHGIGNEWSKTGIIAPLATKSSLTVWDVNPAAAFKINDQVSVGAGLDFYSAKAKLESTPGAGFDLTQEGSGNGVGGNVGLSYVPSANHMVGVSYRTGANFNLDGTFKETGAPDSDVKAELNIPAVLMMGYAYKPTDKLVTELDAQWDKWGIVDNQELKFKDGSGSLTIPKNWRNRWSVGLGAEYALMERLSLRAGYSYYNTPIPNDTFEPSTPDADTHGLSLGAGTVLPSNITLDLALQLYWANHRHIDNAVGGIPQQGTYKTTAQYVAFNIGYKFGQKGQ